MNITLQQQNPLIKFKKQDLNNQKSQKEHSSKITQKTMRLMHENVKIMQKKGKIDIPAQGERILARNLEENDKNISVEPCLVGKREKKF